MWLRWVTCSNGDDRCILVNVTMIITLYGTRSHNTQCFAKSRNWCGLEVLLSDTKFMDTCSFSRPFKKTIVCSKVFAKSMIGFVELVETSSSSSSLATPLALEASPTNKKLKRTCIESFWRFDTLNSQNPKSYGETNVITCRIWVSHALISHM